MTDWSDVAEAQEVQSKAYLAYLAADAEERYNSKKWKAARKAWDDAVNLRAAVLTAHWDEELDGYQVNHPELPSLGRVLQRYYTETADLTRKVKR